VIFWLGDIGEHQNMPTKPVIALPTLIALVVLAVFCARCFAPRVKGWLFIVYFENTTMHKNTIYII
jgi:hypothetical protein